MKRRILMAAVASLVVGTAEQLWAQRGPEPGTWTTPAYGEEGALVSTAYGESGPWVTSAFGDSELLKAGSAGGTTGSAGAPALRPTSSLGVSPSFATRPPKPGDSTKKEGERAALSLTNAPGNIQLNGGSTNGVPGIAPSSANGQSSGTAPIPTAKPTSSGDLDQP